MGVEFDRLEHMPTVKLAMTPFPYCVDVGASLADAREMMVEHDIHHLPVTDDGALVGVISGREVALGTAIASVRDPSHEPRVREACVLHAYVVEDDAPLEGVVAHMAEHRLGSALVTRKGKLVGVFTVTDACRVLAAWLRERFPPPGDDEVA
jgi:acetoin utilization protein AcuB